MPYKIENKAQGLIFDELEHPILDEWEGMPEFVQDQKEPFAKIIVRFRTKEDLDDFSKLIGQPLTSKTKSIWHPYLLRGVHANKRYIDES